MNRSFVKLGISGLMALSSLGLSAQQINPMTEAVLRNYAEALQENPKDYYTLYDRAAMYYNLGEYARALSDIDLALEYIGNQDADYRLAAYSLKADVLTAQKDYTGAIEAEKQALALSPNSAADLYKLGNLQLMANNPQEALKAFQLLQRESPRSQEAFYGMAKANAMMGNKLEAENLLKEVEMMGEKQSFLTYCRIGDLYADMGNIKDATTNYAIAYSMEDTNSRPVESLKFLARKNPKDVMSSLDGIILSSSDNVPLQYLKAILAFDAGSYEEAIKACQALANNVEEESAAIYRMMAMSQLALNRINDANESIAKAEKIAPSNTGVLMDKSEILFSQDPTKAYETISKALAANPDDEAVLLMAAKAAILCGKYPEAQTHLNNVVLGNPSNIEALLLRGYLNGEFLNDAKASTADYTRVGNVKNNGSIPELVMAAMAKSKANKKLDADGIINQALQNAGTDGDNLYWIAIYYAQTGNKGKGKEFADKALLAGYSNIYNLQTNPEPLFNLLPLK